MYRKIKKVVLRNGEEVELGVVIGPDPLWGRKILPLLAHKGGYWIWGIEESLFKNSETESYFYILSKNGMPFANIMTLEKHGIGILGHVWTVPEERKKGAADIIHHHQMEDFKARGGRALYLNTAYDTHPYRLYQKYGFRGCEPESGAMFFFTKGRDAFENEAFAKSSCAIETLAFKHLPALSALTAMKHPAQIRILGMGVHGVRPAEGGALSHLAAMARGDADHDARVAVSNSSFVPVAIASRKPEAHSFGSHVDLIDVFAAPGHEAQIPGLIHELHLESGKKSLCYVDDAWPQKGEWLKWAGFHREAVLKKHFLSQTRELHDVELWSKG